MPQKKEEYITNKVLAVFTVCLSGVLVLMGLRKLIDFGTTYLLGMTVLRALMLAAAVGIAAGIVKMMREKKITMIPPVVASERGRAQTVHVTAWTGL